MGFKDTIALAGYPLTAGSVVLLGFAPTIDATVLRIARAFEAATDWESR